MWFGTHKHRQSTLPFKVQIAAHGTWMTMIRAATRKLAEDARGKSMLATGRKWEDYRIIGPGERE